MGSRTSPGGGPPPRRPSTDWPPSPRRSRRWPSAWPPTRGMVDLDAAGPRRLPVARPDGAPGARAPRRLPGVLQLPLRRGTAADRHRPLPHPGPRARHRLRVLQPRLPRTGPAAGDRDRPGPGLLPARADLRAAGPGQLRLRARVHRTGARRRPPHRRRPPVPHLPHRPRRRGGRLGDGRRRGALRADRPPPAPAGHRRGRVRRRADQRAPRLRSRPDRLARRRTGDPQPWRRHGRHRGDDDRDPRAGDLGRRPGQLDRQGGPRRRRRAPVGRPRARFPQRLSQPGHRAVPPRAAGAG